MYRMDLGNLKKELELERIELEEEVLSLARLVKSYGVNKEGNVCSIDLAGRKWNVSRGLLCFVLGLFFSIIFIVFTVAFKNGDNDLWILFLICAILFSAYSIFVIILTTVLQIKYNEEYKKIVIKLEESKAKLVSCKKKLELLNK